LLSWIFTPHTEHSIVSNTANPLSYIFIIFFPQFLLIVFSVREEEWQLLLLSLVHVALNPSLDSETVSPVFSPATLAFIYHILAFVSEGGTGPTGRMMNAVGIRGRSVRSVAVTREFICFVLMVS